MSTYVYVHSRSKLVGIVTSRDIDFVTDGSPPYILNRKIRCVIMYGRVDPTQKARGAWTTFLKQSQGGE